MDESDLSSLLSSASLVFVGGLLGSVSKLVEQVIVGRTLSVEAYGDASLGLSVLTFSVTLSMLGFAQGVPRYMARFDDEADVRGAWLTGLLVAGLASVVVTGVLYHNVETVAALFFDGAESASIVRTFVLAIPFVVVLHVGIGAIRGLENTRYRTYARDLLYPGARIALLVGLLSVGFGVHAVGYAYLVAAILAAVLAHLLFGRMLPLVGPSTLHVREMLAFSAPLVISTVLSMLLVRTDTLMLGFFRSSSEVGIYAAAYPLANGLLVVLSAFGFLYLPIASRLDADGKRTEVATVYQLTTKWVYVVTFPAFLTFVMFPGDVVRIVWGERYVTGGIALAILSVGFFTAAGAGRNRETLSALGYTTFIMVANAVAFVVNVGLNLALIPPFGFVGAAVASAASFVTLNGCVVAILAIRFDISPFSPQTLRTFLVLPATLLPPTYLLAQVASLSALTFPAFLVAAGVATVAVVSVTGCLQAEDRIALEFVEGLVPVRVPFVRRYLPDRTDS